MIVALKLEKKAHKICNEKYKLGDFKVNFLLPLLQMRIIVKPKNLLFYSRLVNFLSFGNDFLIEYNLFKQSIQKVQYGMN